VIRQPAHHALPGRQTLLKFAERLSAALFRYNEDLAFHWFFTEQKSYLPSGNTLV